MLERLVLGDTLNYTTAVADYPASAGWALTYRLVPRSGAGTTIEFTSTADGDLHRLQVSATTTAAWTAGTWSKPPPSITGSPEVMDPPMLGVGRAGS